MGKDEFYKRVKAQLPCNMHDWTEEQIRAEYKDAKIRQNSEFYLGMIEHTAEEKGVEL